MPTNLTARSTETLIRQLADAIRVQPLIAPVGMGLEMSIRAAQIEDALWAELIRRESEGETINL